MECILDKAILIISGGIEAVPGIERAKQMGLFVIVADGNLNAPGFKICDVKIICSTYDHIKLANLAKNFNDTVRKIDGVISIAADVPLTVSTVAKNLNLIGHSIDTAILSSDKLLMKQKFIEKKIPCPWFSNVENTKHLKEIFKERKQKLVIKPVDSRGSRGVWLIDETINLSQAFEQACDNSPSKRVMIEEYLDGPQISTEAILLPTTASCPGFVDRNYEMLEHTKPYIIENGGTQPSTLPYPDQKAIKNITILAGRALGVISGTVKGDIVMTQSGPKVIEIATRLSGGWFCTDQIPLGTGIDFVGIAIKIALGLEIQESEIEPLYQKGTAIRYFFPSAGKIKSIEISEGIKNITEIKKMMIFVKEGDLIPRIDNHTQRAGFVLTIGKTNLDAVQLATQAISGVNFKIKIKEAGLNKVSM